MQSDDMKPELQQSPRMIPALQARTPKLSRLITLHCLILMLALIQAHSLAQQQPPTKGILEALAMSQLGPSIDLLRELLAIPNDAHYEDHLWRNIDFMAKAFRERGFETRELPTAGPPMLLAQTTLPKAKRNVLLYLQIDGQPTDVSHWAQPDPHQAVLKERGGDGDGWREIPWSHLQNAFNPDWRVFARSAADAKGPAAMFLSALDVMKIARLEPTFNIKVVMDFEEELGSPNLPDAVERHKEALQADWLLIFDGPRHASNRPTLNFGARGIVDLTLTVHGPRAPQHSGHYGNYVPNPALRLSQLLSSMKDERGRVTISGFYDGIELDEATRAILRQTPDDEAEIRRSLGIAAPDAVAATLQEALQFPSLNIRGMASAWVGDQARTIIPATATAEIDIRLVPETSAERLVGLVRAHIEEQGYYVTDGPEPTNEERMQYSKIASFSYQVFYQAFRTPYKSEAGAWLTRALERSFGEVPVRIRISGGSIPISPFVVKLGVPAVGVPTVNKDNNQHSPNENLRLGNYVEGIQTFLAILNIPVELSCVFS